MAFSTEISLLIDTRAGSLAPLLNSRDDFTAAPRIGWVQGDKFELRLYFMEEAPIAGDPHVTIALEAGSTITFGGKHEDDLDSTEFMFAATSFAEVVSGLDTYYSATLDLNTVEIAAWFTANTAKELRFIADIEVNTASSKRITIPQFQGSIWQHAVAGNEGDPAGATPPYPPATDIALAANTLFFAPNITGLTGGTAANLDGQTVVASDAGKVFVFVLSGALVGWQFLAGTDAEDPTGGIVRPDSYATTTFEYIYKQVL